MHWESCTNHQLLFVSGISLPILSIEVLIGTSYVPGTVVLTLGGLPVGEMKANVYNLS